MVAIAFDRAKTTFPRWLGEVFDANAGAIAEAVALARSYMGPLPATGGSAPSHRCAARIGCGASVEEAAAREYLYRWGLALSSHENWEVHTARDARRRFRDPEWSGGAFGVPHTLGL